MIDKIKAEIKELSLNLDNEHGDEFDYTYKDLLEEQMFLSEKCLKWAEDLEKRLKDDIHQLWVLQDDDVDYYDVQPKIIKAFHGGGK